MRQRGITAGELFAKLSRDPAHVARQEQSEEELARRQAELRATETPLREELQKVGVTVDSVWDLVNTADPYTAALPVLLAHVERPYPGRVREGIARALAVRESRRFWGDLVRLFEKEPDGLSAGGDVKFALGLALTAAATRDVFDDVLGLLRDPRHGKARLALIRVVTRLRVPGRDSILEELTLDPDLKLEAADAIKRAARRKRPG